MERLLRSDHDDEIDLFPDILAVKKAENAKAKFIQQYGSKLKGNILIVYNIFFYYDILCFL